MSKKDFYLTIIELVRQGLTLNQIAIKLNISKQSLNYYTSRLKRLNILIKKGYGVWEIDEQEIKNMPWVGLPISAKQVRGHGFQLKLRIPKINNWNRRQEYLNKKNIPYKIIGNNWQGHSILIKGYKVWLTDKTIVVYYPKGSSFYAEDADKAYKLALYEFLQVINRLENMLGVSFKVYGKYHIKPSRQHYSLINNILAKQYKDEKKKLHVYGKDGLWLVIDNSFNLDELETLHPKTARIDSNTTKEYFNDLRDKDHYLPSEVKYVVDNMLEGMELLKRNITLHLDVETRTGIVLENINKAINELRDEIKKKNVSD